jgi:hypothetical protein
VEQGFFGHWRSLRFARLASPAILLVELKKGQVMAITLQILEQRLTALERELADLKAELGRSANSATRGARLIQASQDQHAAVVAAWQAVRERLDIQGQPMGAKQFRQRLVAAGMNPDDNSFSRELIAMREE